MTIIEFLSQLNNLSWLISATGFIRGLYTYKKINPLHRGMCLFLGLMLFIEFLSYLFGQIISNNNMIVLHIYSFTELVFMLWFFKKNLFKKQQLFLMVLGGLGLTYILAEMLIIFVFRGLDIKQFQPYAKIVDNFIIILMCLAYLHEKVNGYREFEWGNFRFTMVLIVFFTINTLFFLPFNFLINQGNGNIFYFYTGYSLAVTLFYLYLAIKVWKNNLRGIAPYVPELKEYKNVGV